MAKHDGIFRRLFADGLSAIAAWSFISYYSEDGSTIPQSQLPDDNSLVTRGMLNIAIGSITLTVITRVPFTSATGLNINWQTDNIPGTTNTYFSVYGNNVEAFVYFASTPGGQPYSWTLDGSNNVNLVSFDWGEPQSGYILF